MITGETITDEAIRELRRAVRAEIEELIGVVHACDASLRYPYNQPSQPSQWLLEGPRAECARVINARVVKCSGCSSPATRRDADDVADVCDDCGEASDDQKRDREKRIRRMAEREEI